MTKKVMIHIFLVVVAVVVILFVSGNVSATIYTALSDQGMGVKNRATGLLLNNGNLTVEIYDAQSGGSIIYNETFVNAINNGSWHVVIGGNSSNSLRLEQNNIYYKAYKINGQVASFTNITGGYTDRQFFYSPMGELGASTNAQGKDSVAMGYNTVASGNYSTALGESNTASGIASTTLGYLTTANDSYAFASGFLSVASAVASTAMGSGTNASGQYSTATGKNTTASGVDSFVAGADSTSSGTASIAMGASVVSNGTGSVALGHQSEARYDRSVAIGHSAIADAYGAMALGYDVTASGSKSTALGNRMTVSGVGSFGIGLNDTAISNYVVTANNTLSIMGGNVGIGTVNPGAILEIRPTLSDYLNIFNITSYNGTPVFLVGQSVSGNGGFAVYDSSGIPGIVFSTNGDSYINSMNTGFGLNNPQRIVHINDTMRLEPRSAPPAGPALGDLYVDSDGKVLCFYNSTDWIAIGGTGSCS